MLAVLTLIAAHNYVDRMALGLLLQEIKFDLRLSDTQLGLVTGLAFALLYATLGIPLARWADRGNRVVLIAVATGIWSTAVALSGMARSFAQLLIARIAAGCGEAGCLPPAHSLIAHYYSRRERPRALSFYMLVEAIGMIYGLWPAAVLNDLIGWRASFVVLGVPGLLLALLAAPTLKEPRQLLAELEQDLPSPPQRSLIAAWAELMRNRTYRNCLIAFSISMFFGTGLLQWKPAFFIRSFGMSTREVGESFAIVYGACGVVGTFLGGWAATRFAGNQEARQLKSMAILYCVYVILSAALFLAQTKLLAILFLTLAMLGGALLAGPLFAIIHAVVPGEVRALAVASVFLCANLIGMGLGPLFVGFLSDMLRPALGDESLRYALLAVTPGYFWAAWHVYRASGSVAQDVASAQLIHGEEQPKA
jgi:MFS family permease